jgi:hypothetical protein
MTEHPLTDEKVNELNELIDSALEELMCIATGGQNMREFYNSVHFIKDVLKLCKKENNK